MAVNPMSIVCKRTALRRNEALLWRDAKRNVTHSGILVAYHVSIEALA